MDSSGAPSHDPPETMPDRAYAILRACHLAASALVALIAIVHMAVTWPSYGSWSSDSLWFLGTGLGLLLLAVLNLSHIGIEPCRERGTRLVRISNWAYAVFGLAAVTAVPEPQAYLALAALSVQAIVSHWTLPGPPRDPD